MDNQWLFDVTDIKQYACCPRLVYYHLCLPDVRPLTYTMHAGIQSHQREEAREDRRSLHHYGLTHGERLFHYPLISEKLGIKGQVDMLIACPTLSATEKALFPVEYKLTEHKAGSHFKLQLTAYAMLLEEAFGIPVERAFLYALPLRKAETIQITPALRKKVLLILQQMRALLHSEQMPAPTKEYRRCPTCEFRRFCNDVV